MEANRPQLILNIEAEDEFRAQVASIYGEGNAKEVANRIAGRAENEGKKTMEILRLMWPEVQRVMRGKTDDQRSTEASPAVSEGNMPSDSVPSQTTTTDAPQSP
jgi:hypothetical protein